MGEFIRIEVGPGFGKSIQCLVSFTREGRVYGQNRPLCYWCFIYIRRLDITGLDRAVGADLYVSRIYGAVLKGKCWLVILTGYFY